MVTAAADGHVRFWNPNNFDLIESYQCDDGPGERRVAIDDRRGTVYWMVSRRIVRGNPGSDKNLFDLRAKYTAQSLQCLSDQNLLCVVSTAPAWNESAVQIFDAATAKELKCIDGGPLRFTSARLSPDGQRWPPAPRPRQCQGDVGDRGARFGRPTDSMETGTDRLLRPDVPDIFARWCPAVRVAGRQRDADLRCPNRRRDLCRKARVPGHHLRDVCPLRPATTRGLGHAHERSTRPHQPVGFQRPEVPGAVADRYRVQLERGLFARTIRGWSATAWTAGYRCAMRATGGCCGKTVPG